MKDSAEKKELLQANEVDIIQGILAAVNDTAITPIEIIRGGKQFLRFNIRPLSEAEFQACREKNTKYKNMKQYGGIRMPEKTNTVGYRSALIIAATTDEDRTKIWNNPALLQGLGVVSAADAVDKILHSGEKDRIVDKIEEISGYTDDEDEDADSAEDTIKN